MNLRRALPFLILGLIGAGSQGCRTSDSIAQPPEPAPILMVCEHGSVKSVMAASLFNKAANERHLPFRAIARGVSPDAAVPPAIAAALARDGFDVTRFVPVRVSKDDVARATRVVVISLEPTALGSATDVAVDAWRDVPAASVNYDAAKASLELHVDALLDELQKTHTR